MACAGLAQAHRLTPMAARTLLQQAVPTTFGFKAAGWLVAIVAARARLMELRGRLASQLGGAAGTLAALGADGSRGGRVLRGRARAGEAGGPVAFRPRPDRRARLGSLGRRGLVREDRARRRPARADRGRRGPGAARSRRILDDAAQAKPGRLGDRDRVRPAGSGGGRRARDRARRGARARARRLAGGVGGALGCARLRRRRGRGDPQACSSRSRSIPAGCSPTSTRVGAAS